MVKYCIYYLFSKLSSIFLKIQKQFGKVRLDNESKACFTCFLISLMMRQPDVIDFLKNYGIGLVVFLIIISPMLLQKYEQFGDPFYSAYQGTMFSKNYEELISNISLNTGTSASSYIENNGILDFIYTFFIIGFFNSMIALSKLSFPYIVILIPFGILFSFRAFDQKSQYTRANWIFILSSIFLMSFILSVVPEKRLLLFLMPFLVLFSVIPIQRVTEYGLSTFSLSRKQKNVFLVIVIIIVIILSGLFTLRYEKLDPVLENEKMDFAKYALENFHGNTLRDFGGGTDYIGSVILLDHNNFQDFKISPWTDGTERSKIAYQEIGVLAGNIEDLILKGKPLNLNYLISNQHDTFYYPFVDQVYHNEEQYPYLIKIFDSDEYGYEKLKIKVFEVENYICWGTPNDYKTYNYWKDFFNDYKWHPYTLSKDITNIQINCHK